jgi:hypothetical protein
VPAHVLARFAADRRTAVPGDAAAHATAEGMLEFDLSAYLRDDMPVFDARVAADGPGRFFTTHPVVYRLALAGTSGASAYALLRLGSPGAVGRPLWAALAVLEAGITASIIRARNSAVTATEGRGV